MFIHYRVIELLLKHDPRPGIRDNEGYNTVHYAALKGHKLSLEMVSHPIITMFGNFIMLQIDFFHILKYCIYVEYHVICSF